MTAPAELHTEFAADPSSIETARSIVAAITAADGVSPVSDQALVAAAQHQRALILFREQPSSDPVAVGIIGQGEVDLVVLPSARGRGVGTAALRALLGHDASDLLAWAHGENPAAEALLSRAGFSPVRSLYRMELDPELLPQDGRDPLTSLPPAGLRLRAFDQSNPGDDAAWVSANAAAFATHPEQGRITEADFALMRAEPWFDANDLLLLEEIGETGEPTGRLAGSTWIKTVREPSTDAGASEVVDTELYAVGVRPEYAGKGIGRFLLDATLARMARHSPTRVSLYVDGENERAVELYRHAGFTIGSRSRQWSQPSRSVAGARIDA